MRVHEQDVFLIDDIHKRYRTTGWNKRSSVRGGRDLSRTLNAYDTADFERFLHEAVRARLNIILAGPTWAGKTTLSKTIISAIPHARRIITIEDVIELKLHQPNVVRLLYSKGDLSGTGITPEGLVEAGMRLAPDIFLLQELRDEAAYSYLTSVCSGHPGSITTIHGRDAADVLRRLSLLVKSCEEGRAMDREDLLDLISASIDVIIPLSRDDDPLPLVHDVWFVADAIRDGKTAADLLR
jgi:type IV secretion system protein VirB11